MIRAQSGQATGSGEVFAGGIGYGPVLGADGGPCEHGSEDANRLFNEFNRHHEDVRLGQFQQCLAERAILLYIC